MKTIKVIGFVILLFGLYLAFFLHSSIWYSFFLIGGFVILESINVRHGFSVLNNKRWFFSVWIMFIVITIATELFGKDFVRAWEYPTYNILEYIFHVIIIGYPFTAFLALELFVLIKRKIPHNLHLIILPICAIIFGYINEIPNTFAHEWIYSHMILGDILGIPVLISVLWLLILLAQLFEKPFFNK